MNKIAVLIVDDHPVIAEGVKKSITTQDNIYIRGIVNNGSEAIKFLEENTIDVLLLDLEMPVMNGVECLKEIQRRGIDVKVIVFSMYQKPSIVKRLIELGIKGYLLKTLDLETILFAIQKVFNGSEYFDSKITKLLLNNVQSSSRKLVHFTERSPKLDLLSKRELEIIIHISKGMTNKMIGEKLFLSHKTVDGYRTKAMRKIGVHNTAGLIRFTFQNGLLEN